MDDQRETIIPPTIVWRGIKKSDLENEKICLKCGAENKSSKRKCTNCKGPLVTEGINFSDFYVKSDKQYPYENFSCVEIN